MSVSTSKQSKYSLTCNANLNDLLAMSAEVRRAKKQTKAAIKARRDVFGTDTPCVTVNQLSHALNVDRATVVDLIKSGELSAYYVRHEYRIKLTDIQTWIESCRVIPKAR